MDPNVRRTQLPTTQPPGSPVKGGSHTIQDPLAGPGHRSHKKVTIINNSRVGSDGELLGVAHEDRVHGARETVAGSAASAGVEFRGASARVSPDATPTVEEIDQALQEVNLAITRHQSAKYETPRTSSGQPEGYIPFDEPTPDSGLGDEDHARHAADILHEVAESICNGDLAVDGESVRTILINSLVRVLPADAAGEVQRALSRGCLDQSDAGRTSGTPEARLGSSPATLPPVAPALSAVGLSSPHSTVPLLMPPSPSPVPPPFAPPPVPAHAPIAPPVQLVSLADQVGADLVAKHAAARCLLAKHSAMEMLSNLVGLHSDPTVAAKLIERVKTTTDNRTELKNALASIDAELLRCFSDAALGSAIRKGMNNLVVTVGALLAGYVEESTETPGSLAIVSGPRAILKSLLKALNTVTDESGYARLREVYREVTGGTSAATIDGIAALILTKLQNCGVGGDLTESRTYMKSVIANRDLLPSAALNEVGHLLAGVKGYAENSESFNAELMAFARDMLEAWTAAAPNFDLLHRLHSFMVLPNSPRTPHGLATGWGDIERNCGVTTWPANAGGLVGPRSTATTSVAGLAAGGFSFPQTPASGGFSFPQQQPQQAVQPPISPVHHVQPVPQMSTQPPLQGQPLMHVQQKPPPPPPLGNYNLLPLGSSGQTTLPSGTIMLHSQQVMGLNNAKPKRDGEWVVKYGVVGMPPPMPGASDAKKYSIHLGRATAIIFPAFRFSATFPRHAKSLGGFGCPGCSVRFSDLKESDFYWHRDSREYASDPRERPLDNMRTKFNHNLNACADFWEQMHIYGRAHPEHVPTLFERLDDWSDQLIGANFA